MFEKKNSAFINTTDTGKTQKSNGNDTATPESTVISVSNDRQSSDTLQGEGDKVSESNAVGGDLFATAERVATEYQAQRKGKEEGVDSSSSKNRLVSDERYEKSGKRTDHQGNPTDENGKLIVERIGSMSDLTDADFGRNGHLVG
ncbi:hypothetical protein [Prevotella corporis]|uniref:Uncharacterized protein n=1 Tax=Prevotella corporis TaxID=28128 RepID=A0A133PT37_9BACT|nr:hypothetical protein [Prevotella corporis]KXA32032.1 hypothetical protein HMPREF3226_02883 [Prevotella corporis]